MKYAQKYFRQLLFSLYISDKESESTSELTPEPTDEPELTDEPEPTDTPEPPHTGFVSLAGAGLAAVLAGAGIVLFRRKRK